MILRIKKELARKNRGNQRGSVLALATALVVLTLTAFSLLAVFLFDSYAGSFYTDKVHLITKQALACYVDELAWNGCNIPNSTSAAAETFVTSEVNEALVQMGLPAATVTCSKSGQVATVNVSVEGLCLLNGPTLFPKMINIQESASGDLGVQHNGMYDLSVSGGSPLIFIPTYGRFTLPWSAGDKPLNTAPWYVATFYDAVQPYNQTSLAILSGDTYSDNATSSIASGTDSTVGRL